MLNVGDQIKVTYLRDGNIQGASNPILSKTATQHPDQKPEVSALAIEESEEDLEKEIAKLEEDMKIKIRKMPKKEAKAMKEKTGIDMPVVQNLSIKKLKIFPNPSQGIFNLNFRLPNNDLTTIKIFDQNGKMIFMNNLGIFTGDYNETIDLSNNPAGTYYLMIQQGDFSISKKVVIVRA